jgi:DNA-binding NarL/FixJ family response regulator
LEEERPDTAGSEHVEQTVDALLARLLPAAMAGLQRQEIQISQPAVDISFVELKTVTKALTRRQLEVLMLLGKGATNDEIAGELGTSVSTIKLHIQSIMKRLEIKTRGHAILLGSRLKEFQ